MYTAAILLFITLIILIIIFFYGWSSIDDNNVRDTLAGIPLSILGIIIFVIGGVCFRAEIDKYTPKVVHESRETKQPIKVDYYYPLNPTDTLHIECGEGRYNKIFYPWHL